MYVFYPIGNFSSWFARHRTRLETLSPCVNDSNGVFVALIEQSKLFVVSKACELMSRWVAPTAQTIIGKLTSKNINRAIFLLINISSDGQYWVLSPTGNASSKNQSGTETLVANNIIIFVTFDERWPNHIKMENIFSWVYSAPYNSQVNVYYVNARHEFTTILSEVKIYNIKYSDCECTVEWCVDEKSRVLRVF